MEYRDWPEVLHISGKCWALWLFHFTTTTVMAAISKGNGIPQGLFGYSSEMAEETYKSGSQGFPRLHSFSLVPWRTIHLNKQVKTFPGFCQWRRCLNISLMGSCLFLTLYRILSLFLSISCSSLVLLVWGCLQWHRLDLPTSWFCASFCTTYFHIPSHLNFRWE